MFRYQRSSKISFNSEPTQTVNTLPPTHSCNVKPRNGKQIELDQFNIHGQSFDFSLMDEVHQEISVRLGNN